MLYSAKGYAGFCFSWYQGEEYACSSYFCHYKKRSLGAHASKRNIQQFLTYFTKLFVEEVDYHIRFLIERGDNVWWLDGERVKFRAETTSKILNLMYEHPDITLASLSEQVGVNVAAINKQIRQLTNKGYSQRAADSNWRLIVTPSV